MISLVREGKVSGAVGMVKWYIWPSITVVQSLLVSSKPEKGNWNCI